MVVFGFAFVFLILNCSKKSADSLQFNSLMAMVHLKTIQKAPLFIVKKTEEPKIDVEAEAEGQG